MIWLLGVLVALLASAALSLPWWLPAFTQRRSLRRRAANVAAFRTRLRELEADVASGVLAPDAVAAMRQELETRLLGDVDEAPEPELAGASSLLLPAGCALALLVFAGAWYAMEGGWRTQALIELARLDPEGARQQSVNDSIARLRARVESHPEEVESWTWLGRSYLSRGSFSDAAQAFAKANELRGQQDPDLLVEEGEALAYAQERSMAGAPAERFAAALALAPGHPQALWYAGIAAVQSGDDARAIELWERLQKQELADDMRGVVAHSLMQLRARSGIKAPAQTAAAPAPAASGLQLEVDISIAPELAGKVQPSDTLFVFAQDPSGPPMPVAVQRLPPTLPARTTLDDSNSPMPTHKLSSLDRWRLVARVSRSGNAIPQAGDLEGTVELGKADASKPVRIVISRTR